MTDHKFEPFQQVLVRDGELTAWRPAFFASVLPGIQPRYETISGVGYLRCIPYTPETAHLLGTNAPYEPHKPPHEYKWGQKVEALKRGEWNKGLYICCVPIGQLHRVYTDKHGDGLFAYTEIRPMPDDTAAHLDAKP